MQRRLRHQIVIITQPPLLLPTNTYRYNSFPGFLYINNLYPPYTISPTPFSPHLTPILPSLQSIIQGKKENSPSYHAPRQHSHESVRQHMNHLIAPNPIIMNPRQPALRMTVLVGFADVLLVCCEDPGSVFEQIGLQDGELRRVA